MDNLLGIGKGARRQGRRGIRAAASLAVAGLVLAGGGVAFADDIYNTLDGSVDSVAEIMALNVGGPNGSTTLAVHPTNEEGGKVGCNLSGKGSPTLTLNLVSSHPSVATVSPSTATFTSCGSAETITITPVSAGSASITASIASNTSGGSFNLAPAAFTINVAPAAPSNTAPVLSISEVANGASYPKGAVPAATCNVTDTEDGPSTFPATLSAISGPDAATGIGSQTASCSYTDVGGITVASSVTYGITDGTAPVITYTLDPSVPDGTNDWYRSAVTLDWTVTEGDSPSTLVLAGCTDQAVTVDQLPTNYTCSASSSGGSAETVTVSIKKDGTAPTVSYADATGTAGNNGWYTSNVSARFAATDATSGLVTSSQSVPSSGEGAAVEVLSPAFTDIAGNTRDAGAAVQTFKIDKTAPTVTFNSEIPDDYYGSTPAAPTCQASDSLSGLAGPCTVSGYSTAVGLHTLTATATDQAGNNTTITQEYEVKAWTLKGFYQPVDMSGILNTVKGGSTVPAKFEVFAGDREITDPGLVAFSAARIQCTNGATEDAIEVVVTGNTSLRYDAIAGQFVYNWKTPTIAGNCYRLTMTAADGGAIVATFKLK